VCRAAAHATVYRGGRAQTVPHVHRGSSVRIVRSVLAARPTCAVATGYAMVTVRQQARGRAHARPGFWAQIAQSATAGIMVLHVLCALAVVATCAPAMVHVMVESKAMVRVTATKDGMAPVVTCARLGMGVPHVKFAPLHAMVGLAAGPAPMRFACAPRDLAAARAGSVTMDILVTPALHAAVAPTEHATMECLAPAIAAAPQAGTVPLVAPVMRRISAPTAIRATEFCSLLTGPAVCRVLATGLATAADRTPETGLARARWGGLGRIAGRVTRGSGALAANHALD